MAVYAGSTPQYLLEILDKAGTRLDPSNVAQVAEVKIYIYNSITGVIIGRFYLNTAPDPADGWSQLTTVTLEVGDVRVLLTLTSAMTLAAEGNSNEIQVNAHIVDTDAPDNVRIDIEKCKFPEILPAKT